MWKNEWEKPNWVNQSQLQWCPKVEIAVVPKLREKLNELDDHVMWKTTYLEWPIGCKTVWISKRIKVKASIDLPTLPIWTEDNPSWMTDRWSRKNIGGLRPCDCIRVEEKNWLKPSSHSVIEWMNSIWMNSDMRKKDKEERMRKKDKKKRIRWLPAMREDLHSTIAATLLTHGLQPGSSVSSVVIWLLLSDYIYA